MWCAAAVVVVVVEVETVGRSQKRRVPWPAGRAGALGKGRPLAMVKGFVCRCCGSGSIVVVVAHAANDILRRRPGAAILHGT